MFAKLIVLDLKAANSVVWLQYVYAQICTQKSKLIHLRQGIPNQPELPHLCTVLAIIQNFPFSHSSNTGDTPIRALNICCKPLFSRKITSPRFHSSKVYTVLSYF